MPKFPFHKNVKNNKSIKRSKPVKDELKEPAVEGFEIPAVRSGSLEEIVSVLSQVSYIQTVIDGKDIVLLNIESRDLDKRPYLFSMIYLQPDKIKVLYTVTVGMSPKKRRIDVLRYFFTILSMISEYYEIKMADIYQLFEDSIDKISEYVTLDYEEMYAKYDSMKSENERLKRDIARLKETNRELSKENYEIKTKVDNLKIKLQRLSKYSDDSLNVRIMEWIKEHDGEINIPEFSRMYGIPDKKTEELLNKLIKQGYIESV
ncbi:hypothetical protein J7J90_04855 [Candidatus Micrarchaeota archaeon]|nr:hypothetical protein [Candidatus Micrarchaeota archaeon]